MARFIYTREMKACMQDNYLLRLDRLVTAFNLHFGTPVRRNRLTACVSGLTCEPAAAGVSFRGVFPRIKEPGASGKPAGAVLKRVTGPEISRVSGMKC